MKKTCILSIILSAVLAGTTAVPCFAGTVEDLESKISDGQSSLQSLQTQLDTLGGEYSSLQTQLADGQYELKQLQEDLQNAEEDKAEQHEGMKTRIQFIYEAFGGDSNAFALCASVLGGAAVTAEDEAIAELTQYDRTMLEEYQDTCNEIEDKTKEVTAQQQKLQELTADCREKQQEITALIEDTNAQIAQYQEELSDAKETELLQKIQQQEAVLQAVFQSDGSTAVETTVKVSHDSLENAASGNTGTVVTGTTENSASEQLSDSAEEEETSPAYQSISSGWSGSTLNRNTGVVTGPNGKETYYNLDMSGVVEKMRQQGNTDGYWVRDDGVKMLGNYVMVAADLSKYPRGTIVDSSLGKAIVCDTGDFITGNSDQLDVAVAW